MIQNPEKYLTTAVERYVVGAAKLNHREQNYNALSQP